MGKLGVLEVKRKFEFAPIKNADAAEGIALDSPASAKDLLLAESKYWLMKAGHPFDSKHKLYVSPLLSYEGEGLEDVKMPDLSQEDSFKVH
jgi:UDP-N-acetylglucosamine/UDP-N-acetylgalactosamine diphosphorylase